MKLSIAAALLVPSAVAFQQPQRTTLKQNGLHAIAIENPFKNAFKPKNLPAPVPEPEPELPRPNDDFDMTGIALSVSFC